MGTGWGSKKQSNSPGLSWRPRAAWQHGRAVLAEAQCRAGAGDDSDLHSRPQGWEWDARASPGSPGSPLSPESVFLHTHTPPPPVSRPSLEVFAGGPGLCA